MTPTEIMEKAQANIEKGLNDHAVSEIEELLKELCAARIVVKNVEARIVSVKKDLTEKLTDIAAV